MRARAGVCVCWRTGLALRGDVLDGVLGRDAAVVLLQERGEAHVLRGLGVLVEVDQTLHLRVVGVHREVLPIPDVLCNSNNGNNVS